MSGGSNDSTQTTTSSLPAWVEPYMRSYLDRAVEVSDLPYQQYTGQTVAGMNDAQYQAMDAIRNRAISGSPVMNTAAQSLQSIAGGSQLGQQSAQNPYLTARNEAANTYNPQAGASNPYLQAQNPLAQAENPYLQKQIDAASADVTRNYRDAVMPQMDAARARSGSFGNSGLEFVQQRAQDDLAKQLGNISSGMRMQDYTQRQGLQENAVNRLYQGGATLQSQQYGAGQQQAQNQFNAGQQYANQLFSGGQALQSANNQLQSQAMNNQLQALGLAPSYAAQDYTDANALMNVGNALQQQQQSGLTSAYSQWQQAQQYPVQQLQTMGNALGFNFGQQQQTTSGGGRGSTLGNAAGGALTGWGATGSPWGAAIGAGLGLLG